MAALGVAWESVGGLESKPVRLLGLRVDGSVKLAELNLPGARELLSGTPLTRISGIRRISGLVSELRLAGSATRSFWRFTTASRRHASPCLVADHGADLGDRSNGPEPCSSATCPMVDGSDFVFTSTTRPSATSRRSWLVRQLGRAPLRPQWSATSHDSGVGPACR